MVLTQYALICPSTHSFIFIFALFSFVRLSFMSVHLLMHFTIYHLSLLCLFLWVAQCRWRQSVCVGVCACVRACVRVCQISVGYSDSRAEGLSLVTFLQLYGVAPRSTSRRPFCFCSSTRKNRVRERDGGVLQEILLSKKRLNYDLGARETGRQKTETKTWKEFRELF